MAPVAMHESESPSPSVSHPMLRHLIVAAALAAAVSRTGAAQRLGPPEDRPRLRDVTDTNDAQAYYNLGLAQFERDPDEAAAAFYWAARINPASGEALYGRRAALLMKNKFLLRKVMEGDRRTIQSPEVRRLDSLEFRAMMLSPFLYQRLERPMFLAYIREQAATYSRMNRESEPSRAELDFMIASYLQRAGPLTRAWVAYGEGDFDRALANYANGLDGARDKASVRLDRARIFGMRSDVDSAVHEFNLALAEMRTRDEKELVIFYKTKALAEYSIAVLLEGAGSADSAREAYGRALQEDLAYYPAHMRLGLMALGKKDTATAASELALATQLASEEPYLRYIHGWALGVARRYPEAVAELKQAVTLEPMYALPYLRLGQIYEAQEKGPEALEAYEAFLAHAAKTDLQREYALGRASDLKEMLAFEKEHPRPADTPASGATAAPAATPAASTPPSPAAPARTPAKPAAKP